jgi:GT2 family glycosyltransferase
MRFGICITTRNRVQELQECLQAIECLTVKPDVIVVSDDSIESDIQSSNRQIVLQHGGIYLQGPLKGVCANRNNALRKCLKNQDLDYISFVDDDVCLEQGFIENATRYYEKLSENDRTSTILTGITQSQDDRSVGMSRLTFRGYFTPADSPEVVNIHAAVFPVSLFENVMWDENIFFGYEDAELCLRASRKGFQIVYVDSLIALHTRFCMGTLTESSVGALSQYDVSVEAARLYVGIKRYKLICPSPVRLVLFVAVYFAHISLFLMRKGKIQVLPNIVALSNIRTLFDDDVLILPQMQEVLDR